MLQNPKIFEFGYSSDRILELEVLDFRVWQTGILELRPKSKQGLAQTRVRGLEPKLEHSSLSQNLSYFLSCEKKNSTIQKKYIFTAHLELSEQKSTSKKYLTVRTIVYNFSLKLLHITKYIKK